jgi:hypothetical protein
VEGSLGATIDTAKLNLDSSGAYTLARETAASEARQNRRTIALRARRSVD